MDDKELLKTNSVNPYVIAVNMIWNYMWICVKMETNHEYNLYYCKRRRKYSPHSHIVDYIQKVKTKKNKNNNSR